MPRPSRGFLGPSLGLPWFLLWLPLGPPGAFLINSTLASCLSSSTCLTTDLQNQVVLFAFLLGPPLGLPWSPLCPSRGFLGPSLGPLWSLLWLPLGRPGAFCIYSTLASCFSLHLRVPRPTCKIKWYFSHASRVPPWAFPGPFLAPPGAFLGPPWAP